VIPGGVRIFVCTEPVDMRYGFDRLAQVARERVGQDPVAGGALFVFVGRTTTRLKVLWFDRNGLCLLYKRLHRAVFELPAAANGGRVDSHRRCGPCPPAGRSCEGGETTSSRLTARSRHGFWQAAP
jgi:transposase